MAAFNGALPPGTDLGTPRSRVKGHCSWKGGREWSGMLALWLNWALGIPGSFTEWPVSATETRRERFAFQPQELPGPTGCCGNMANFW